MGNKTRKEDITAKYNSVEKHDIDSIKDFLKQKLDILTNIIKEYKERQLGIRHNETFRENQKQFYRDLDNGASKRSNRNNQY